MDKKTKIQLGDLLSTKNQRLLASNAMAKSSEFPLRGRFLLMKLRAKSGLNLKGLGKQIDMRANNICMIEKGKRPIGKIVAKRFAAYFGINWEQFICDKEQ